MVFWWTGKAKAYSHTPVMDVDGDLWFTQFQGNNIGRLDTATGKIREYATAGQPYGIALDRLGGVWFSQFMAGKLARLDPETGKISELSVGAEARPRRMAVAPNGSLWVALYAAGKLVRLEPPSMRIVRTYDLPGGLESRPYAVAIDSLGRVYTSATGTNRILRLEPRTGEIEAFPLPGEKAMVRGLTVDLQGRIWYAASATGRLGVLK